MRKAVLFGAMILCLVSCKKEEEMELKTSTVEGLTLTFNRMNPEYEVNSIFFVNEQTGYIVGDNGMFYKTTTGGEGWMYMSFPLTSSIKDCWFLNENLGYAVGGGSNETDSCAVILRTTDGGSHWEDVLDTIINEGFESIAFADDSIGFAVGNKILCKTSNGGISWDVVEIPDFFIGMQVHFASPSLGFVLMFDDVLRTEDGGILWENTTSSGGSHYVTLDGSVTNGLYGGAGYGITKSADLGKTWTLIEGTPSSLTEIAVLPGNRSIAFGYGDNSGYGGYYYYDCFPQEYQGPSSCGAISYTKDGWQTWVSNKSIWECDQVISVSFPTANLGWALANDGTVIRIEVAN